MILNDAVAIKLLPVPIPLGLVATVQRQAAGPKRRTRAARPELAEPNRRAR